MNLQWVNGELIDMDVPLFATTTSNSTVPTTSSAGLSDVLSDIQLQIELNSLSLSETFGQAHEIARKVVASHRALAQRLREAEARLSTVIRVSAAQAQRRLAQLEDQLDAEHTKPATRQDSVIRNAHDKHDANHRLGGDRGL
jgi:hypothetical protein